MDDRSARIERRLQAPLLVAAVLTIPTTIVEESHLRQPWPDLAAALNWAIWLVFVAEVAIMLAVVPSRRRWLSGHVLELGIVVLTVPVLLSAVQPIRMLRVLRAFRLLRLAPLVRHLMSAEGLQYVAAIALMTAIAGGAAFAAVEKYSVGTGFYWAITTMTTVGYGDITPKTTEGRVVAIVVMLVGTGTAALVIGAIAQRFTTVKVEEELDSMESGQEDVLAEVRDIARRLQRLERRLERS